LIITSQKKCARERDREREGIKKIEEARIKKNGHRFPQGSFKKGIRKTPLRNQKKKTRSKNLN
jgi:hypothetical protein